MAPAIEIKSIPFSSSDYHLLVELRYRVLRQPLGLEYSGSDLAKEKDDVHLGAFLNGELVGCLLLHDLRDGTLKMRQVATAPEQQGKGVGRHLVVHAEEIGRAEGFREMVLSARSTAVPFYLRLGYEVCGDPFVEVTLPHRKMRKVLVVQDPDGNQFAWQGPKKI